MVKSKIHKGDAFAGGVQGNANARAGIYPKFVVSPANMSSRMTRTGLPYFLPGWIRRDFLPELQGRNLWLQFEEMGSNDAYVGSALNVYSLFIRRTNWHVDPGCEENNEDGSAEFLESCMSDMQHSWQTFIATAARPCLQFGFAPFEKIYKRRGGDDDEELKTSEYEDGAIGWGNLSFLAPDSILHWDFDPKEVTKLLGLTQLAPPDYRSIFIPIQKILNLRSEPGRDNPEGHSILRIAWRAWKIKTLMEDLRNLVIDRGGAGIPWAQVPPNIASATELLAANPTDPKIMQDKLSYESIVSSLEKICLQGKQYIITPRMYDKEKNELITFGFLQASQNSDIINHITGSIEAEAKAILIATGTEFQALGMGGSGSLALSKDKTDNFTLAVSAVAQSFQESINNNAVRQLFKLNPQFEFRQKKPRPRIVFDPLAPLNTNEVVAMLGLFEKAGWDLSEQRGIRDAIIKNLGLPDFIEKEVKEKMGEAGDGKDAIASLLDGKSAVDMILQGGRKAEA